jgi:hypothetical protein
MHWTIAAPFFNRSNLGHTSWLERYVPGHQHQFTLIPREKPLPSWHERKSKFTTLDEWLLYWQQGAAAVKATEGGVITVFPQLAAVAGMQQQLLGSQVPVVAWLFNVGTCHGGLRKQFSKVSLRQITRFIVHTRRERQIYSDWLELPIERFEFVPYQVPEIPVTYAEDTQQPFIAALGSAHRDFSTLFKAVETLKIPTVVASGPRALAGLEIPAQVQTPLGMSKADCLKLAQQARINVVPLAPNHQATAAGQVTIVEAMRMGRALIATRGSGVEDYISDGETGLLAEPHSVTDLMQAIQRLWDDAALRQRISQNAMQYAATHCSDQAAGRALGQVLDAIAEPKQAALDSPELGPPELSSPVGIVRNR